MFETTYKISFIFFFFLRIFESFSFFFALVYTPRKNIDDSVTNLARNRRKRVKKKK